MNAHVMFVLTYSGRYTMKYSKTITEIMKKPYYKPGFDEPILTQLFPNILRPSPLSNPNDENSYIPNNNNNIALVYTNYPYLEEESKQYLGPCLVTGRSFALTYCTTE